MPVHTSESTDRTNPSPSRTTLNPTDCLSNVHAIPNDRDSNDASRTSVQHPVADSAPVEQLDADDPPPVVAKHASTGTTNVLPPTAQSNLDASHSQEQTAKRLKVDLIDYFAPRPEPATQARPPSTTNDHHRTRPLNTPNKPFDGPHTPRFQQRNRNPPNQFYASPPVHYSRPNLTHSPVIDFSNQINGNRRPPSTDWNNPLIHPFHNPISRMDSPLPPLLVLPNRK